MPELPEVENVRRTLANLIIGRTITSVNRRRRDVVHGPASDRDLMLGHRISKTMRHGKQIAVLGTTVPTAPQRCVCIHLGMSGSLRLVRLRPEGRPSRTASGPRSHHRVCHDDSHVHIVWGLDNGDCIRFRDPRRFGGIWTYPGLNQLLEERWRDLGPDALTIQPSILYQRLHRTQRGIKAALLDQNVIAGLGNIYTDELLFRCHLNPLTASRDLKLNEVQRLVRCMRRLLSRATAEGGSTLRDYVDGHGNPGRFQTGHQVYGRAGELCQNCHEMLQKIQVAGRTTVYCPSCQGTTIP